MAFRPLMPSHCAVRVHDHGQGFSRCWRELEGGSRCPVHGDVTGVQFRFRETGALTDDFELRDKKLEPPPPYGSEEWLERFRRANRRAEIVAWTSKGTFVVRLKRADADFPRLYSVTGGTPEMPELREV